MNNNKKVDARTLEGTRLGSAQREIRAIEAGKACLLAYGRDYYSAIGKKSAMVRKQANNK